MIEFACANVGDGDIAVVACDAYDDGYDAVGLHEPPPDVFLLPPLRFHDRFSLMYCKLILIYTTIVRILDENGTV